MNDNTKESFDSGDFALNVQNLIETFVNFGDELSGLNDIDDKFFAPYGAISTPVVGKNLIEIWQTHIENDLSDFITAYNSWIDMVKAEGRLREDFQRESVDLFAKAQKTAKEMEDAMRNPDFVEGMGDLLNTGTDSTTDPTISLSGMTEEQLNAKKMLTTSQQTEVERLFENGGDITKLTPEQQNYLEALKALFTRELGVYGFETNNGETVKLDGEFLTELLETPGQTKDEMIETVQNYLEGVADKITDGAKK